MIDPSGQVRTCNHSPMVVGDILSDEIITLFDTEISMFQENK